MSKKENTNTIVLETIVPEIARNLNTIVKRVKKPLFTRTHNFIRKLITRGLIKVDGVMYRGDWLISTTMTENELAKYLATEAKKHPGIVLTRIVNQGRKAAIAKKFVEHTSKTHVDLAKRYKVAPETSPLSKTVMKRITQTAIRSVVAEEFDSVFQTITTALQNINADISALKNATKNNTPDQE